MPHAGFAPISIEKFGGLASFVDPTNLPMYSTPDCFDVEFVEGLVRTRPGFISQFPTLSLISINYLKSFVTDNLGLRMFTLDSVGNIYVENPQGTLTLIASPIFGAATVANSYGNSVSLFTREYLAMGDGKFGLRKPLQMNDQFIDLVTQSGPGIAPQVIDEILSYTISASPTGIVPSPALTITAATEAGNLVTLTVSSPWPAYLKVGDTIVVAGVGVAGYNGTFTVSYITSSTQIQYTNSVSGLANSSGGTAKASNLYVVSTTANNVFVAGQSVTTAGVTGGATYIGTFTVRSIVNASQFILDFLSNVGAATGGGTVASAGNIVAGKHNVSVLYVDREGYLTRPSPPSSWVASGNKRAIVSLIPIPPGTVAGQLSNIVSRIVCFTPVNALTYFYQDGRTPVFSGNMIIPDITTTTQTIDFSDQSLLEGVNVDDLFDLVELGPCAGVTQSGSRLFWWGERAKLDNLLNLGFEGGGADATVPGGWTIDLTSGNGGLVSTETVSAPGYLGAFYHIQGNGSATVGLITQSLYQDYLGNPILSPKTDYSIRAIVQGAAASGTLHIHAFSTSAGINTTGITLTGTHGAQEIILPLITAAQLTTVPKDLVLRVYADGTPGAFDVFKVYNIEIFETNKPYNVTTVRVSRVPDANGLYSAESYNGVDGFLDVAPSNGQAVRSVFTIRNNIYLVKERSIYVTDDNGQEPGTWNIQEVSGKVGTLSVRGVGLGDEWAIIAAQDGVYYFDGSTPQKISQEIAPTWAQINWAFGHLVSVTVDIERKRAYILAPFGSATTPNRMLTLDYSGGFTDPTPVESVAIAGMGRKWSPWAVSGNSMALILRNDGTLPLFVGNNTDTGKILGLDPTPWAPGNVFADDGVAINSYYQTGYFQDIGRMDFGYISSNMLGQGQCSLILRKGDQGWISNLRGWNLSPLGFHNVERNIGSIVTERLAVRIGTNAPGSCFSLQGLAMWSKKAAWSPLRGVNF